MKHAYAPWRASARWPLPSPAALVSIIALVVSVVGYNAPD